MLGFSPFKKHANRFNYTPRYYDPEREAREQRRAELRGERSDADAEYAPGERIRLQRSARMARREREEEGRRNKFWTSIVVVAVVFVLVYMLVPRMVSLVTGARQAAPVESVEEFDPYAPIVVVPNDYEE